MTTDNPPALAGFLWYSSFPDSAQDHALVARRQAGNDPLAPVRAVAEALGSPHLALPCLHVAGTKGKGSCVLLMERILQQLGYKTGRFTSPAIYPGEQFAVGGRPIHFTGFCRGFSAFRLHLQAQGVEQPLLTRFELEVLFALDLFRREQVDVAIVETGLGGRFDATNIIEQPRACLLTSIGYEHTATLGTTLERIVWHKSGILKTGCPAVVRRQQYQEVRGLVAAAAAREGADLVFAEDRVRVEVPGAGDSCAIWSNAKLGRLPIGGLVPHHLAGNIEAALATLEVAGFLDESNIAKMPAITPEMLALPARMEVADSVGPVVVDAAHCPMSMHATVDALNAMFSERPWTVLISIMSDKNAQGILEELAKLRRIVRLLCFKGSSPRSLPPEDLAHAANAIGWPCGMPDIVANPETLECLLDHAPESGRHDGGVLLTGSFSHVHALRDDFSLVGPSDLLRWR